MRTDLEKDAAILSVLDRLAQRLGKDAFVIADHWPQDLCAIGVASTGDARVLAYISCFGNAAEQFDIELELPSVPGDDFPYQVAGRASHLSFDELATAVAEHLGLPRPGGGASTAT